MADVDTAIDSYLGRRRQQTVEELKLSVSNALTVNPDQEAEARRTASTLNIPVDTVRDNLPEARQQVRMQQTDFGMLADRFPRTSSYLSSQQNANLSHDDVDNLSNLESLVNPKAPSLTQLNEVIGQIGNFAKGSGLSILSGAGPAVSEGMWGGVRAAAEMLPGDMGSPLAAYAANKAKTSRGIKEAWGGQSESMLGAGWNSGMQSLGMNLATLPLGFGGKVWPVLTAMGAITGGQSYGEARDQGVSVPTAFNYGLSQGMIEAGTERIGMPALFSILKPGHFGTKALEYMLKEQGGEQIATVLQDLNDWSVLPENKDKSFSDYLSARPDAAIQTALATAFGGGGQVALMKGVQLLVSRGDQQVSQAEQATAMLEKLNEFAKASNTLRRDPDTFQQFIADASEGGPVQQVFIDANMLMQSGLAEQIAQVSLAVAEQLPIAAQTGGQIAIPVDEFAARIAPTEYAQSLIDHLKTDPDGFTRAEAQEFMQSGAAQEINEHFERAISEASNDDTFKQSADVVRDNVKAQLDEVSRFKPDVNAAYADMVGKVFAVYAAKIGITPEEMYQRYPLRIAGASVGGQNLSQEHGAFGPIFHEFKGDYHGALAKLKESKTGEAVGALHHPDIGDIDLVWGEEGTGQSDGYGLSKLLKYHPEVIDNLQDILNDMKIVRRVNIPGRERVYLESSEYRAGIRLTWDNEAKHWLLTAFRKKESGGGAATYTDTNGLAGQDDTASLTDASDDIVDQKLNQFYQSDEARGAFNPSTNTIALLQKADLSTFLHESGHFFLEVQFDLAGQIAKEAEVFGHETNTEGQQTILADTNALLKWFGLRDLAEWDSLSFEEKRSYHEQFARGFEAYLFEGKSPSIEMNGLFQRFRAWLVSVYKSLNALNVDLTDEVRGVFDRMVATTEEIQLAEQGRSMFPMFESAEQAGITPEEFAQYQALGIDATNDSIQALQAKGLRDMQWLHNARGREIKKLQKKAAALRAEAEIEARRDVMSQPIYQAWSFLTRKITAEDKLPKVEAAKGSPGTLNPDTDSLFVAIAKLGGIQRESARVDLSVHKDTKIPMAAFGKPVLRREGGMTVDQMADSLFAEGYLSAHDLREFEEKFHNELSGQLQYLTAYDYAANDYFRPGDQVANPSALEAGRLDIAELNLMGLPPEVTNAIKARRMTASNGLHPDIVADKFEFTSGDELVRKLAAATPPKEAIATLTDQLMLERHGELSSPEAIARSADQAIHNNARARFIATEANALAKATGERKVLTSAARNFANSLIARLRVRDVKPTQYANAEQRASKAADKARRQGNMNVAAAEKRNQLAQNYAARAAYQALDDIDAALKYFDRVQKPGKLPADYYERIIVLLSKFDLRKSTTLKELDNAARFRTWVTAQLNSGNVPPNFESLLSEDSLRAYQKELTRRDEDGELIYPDEESQAVLLATYFDEQPVRSYKDVTVSELLGLRDAVMQIEHLGRRTQKVLTDRKNREFTFAIDQIRTSIREVAEKAGRRGTDNMTPNTKTGKIKQMLRGYGFSHIKAANLMHIIDGGAGGPLWEYLGRTANAAADGEAIDLSSAHDKIKELLDLLEEGGKITDNPKDYPTLGTSLNRNAILAIAMNLGNDSNRSRLLQGGLVIKGIPSMVTMEQLLPALQTLTAKDWQFVQGMWDYYESFRPKVGEMERLINGVEPTWIEAVPLTVHTADGQTLHMRGGYAPVIFDPRASSRASMFEEEKDAKAMLQAARVANTVRKSFTKERVEEVKGRPLMLDLGAFVGAFQDTIHYLHWQPWIIDANRIIKTLDPTIREYYGHEVVKQMKDWVRDSAVGIQAPRDAVEKVGSFVARNVSFAGLAYNFFNAIQQVTGYSQSVSVIGSGWMMKGVSYSLKNRRQAYLDCVDKSEFMRKRAQTRMRDIAEANLIIQDENKARVAFERSGYLMMTTMQTAVDLPTWWGGYMKALAEGRSEDTAIALGDQAVIDSQGSGLQKDLAKYERSANGYVRIFAGFMSFMNVTLNLNYRTIKSNRSVSDKIVDLMLLNVIPVALTMMLKALLMPKGGDDDKEWVDWAKDYALEQASFMIGQMVFVREASQFAYGLAGQGRGYSGPSGTRVFGDLANLGIQMGQGEYDDGLRKALINILGDFLRLPSVQINRTWTGVESLSEGETENPGAVMFGFRR